MKMKSLDDLIDKFQNLMDEAYLNYQNSDKFENRYETKYWLGVYQAYKNSLIISETLQANMEAEKEKFCQCSNAVVYDALTNKCCTCGMTMNFPFSDVITTP